MSHVCTAVYQRAPPPAPPASHPGGGGLQHHTASSASAPAESLSMQLTRDNMTLLQALVQPTRHRRRVQPQFETLSLDDPDYMTYSLTGYWPRSAHGGADGGGATRPVRPSAAATPSSSGGGGYAVDEGRQPRYQECTAPPAPPIARRGSRDGRAADADGDSGSDYAAGVYADEAGAPHRPPGRRAAEEQEDSWGSDAPGLRGAYTGYDDDGEAVPPPRRVDAQSRQHPTRPPPPHPTGHPRDYAAGSGAAAPYDAGDDEGEYASARAPRYQRNGDYAVDTSRPQRFCEAVPLPEEARGGRRAPHAEGGDDWADTAGQEEDNNSGNDGAYENGVHGTDPNEYFDDDDYAEEGAPWDGAYHGEDVENSTSDNHAPHTGRNARASDPALQQQHRPYPPGAYAAEDHPRSLKRPAAVGPHRGGKPARDGADGARSHSTKKKRGAHRHNPRAFQNRTTHTWVSTNTTTTVILPSATVQLMPMAAFSVTEETHGQWATPAGALPPARPAPYALNAPPAQGYQPHRSQMEVLDDSADNSANQRSRFNNSLPYLPRREHVPDADRYHSMPEL